MAAYLEAISAQKRTVPYKGDYPLNQPEGSNRHSYSAATAAGGLGILAVSAIPAMYRLNLLSAEPQKDVGRLIALVFCAGFFGVFFVIPLRKYYIVHQKLTFPTPAATVIASTCPYHVGIANRRYRHTPSVHYITASRVSLLPERSRSPFFSLSYWLFCTRF